MWHKKIEKSLMSGVDAKELGLKAERRRHEERLKEIEKVKQQREQRERERVEKEEEREIMAREEALIEAVELEKKEEEFHLQQAKMRSDIRVKERAARAAIDLVSRNIHAEPGAPEFDFGVHPLEIFDGLTVSEMDELVDDLRNYEHLDREDARRGFFWSNMIAVADAELFEARRREDIDRARVRGWTRAISSITDCTPARRRSPRHARGKILRRAGGVGGGDRGVASRARRGRERILDRRAPPGGDAQGSRGGGGRDDEDASRAVGGSPEGGPIPAPPLGSRGGKTRTTKISSARTRQSRGGAGGARGRPRGRRGGACVPPRYVPRAHVPRRVHPGRHPRPMLLPRTRSARRRRGPRGGGRGGGQGTSRGRYARRSARRNSEGSPRRAPFRERRGGALGGARDVEGSKASTSAAEGAAGALRPPPGEEPEVDEDTRRSKALAEKMMGDSGGAEVAFAGEAPLESRVYWWHLLAPAAQAQVLQPRAHGVRVEQVQPDALRPRQSAAEDGAGVQVQRLLPGSHRQDKGAHVHHHPGRVQTRRDVHSDSRGAAVRGHRVQDRQQGVGVQQQARVQVLFERGIFHLYINFKRARYRR